MANHEQRTKTALSSIQLENLSNLSHKELMALAQQKANEKGADYRLEMADGSIYIGHPEGKMPFRDCKREGR